MNNTLLPFLLAPAGTLSATLLWLIIGLCVGSFLNVVIHRIPIMMQRESENYLAIEQDQPLVHQDRYNLILPRSACPACGHTLSFKEIIPIFSYFKLHRRCSNCSTTISYRYPLVEGATGLLSGLVVWMLGSELAGLSALIFVWMLIAMTFIDIDTQTLPDDLTLPLLWLGLLINLNGVFVPLSDAVIGAAAGYLFLWIVFWVFRFITGKEGIGYGDFKLLAALGAWLGWMMLPLIVLLSSAIGAAIGLIMILFRGHQREHPIPFGPFLALAGLVALLAGKPLIELYLGYPL